MLYHYYNVDQLNYNLKDSRKNIKSLTIKNNEVVGTNSQH